MGDRRRARRYVMRAGIELVSSLFIVLFPYSAVSLMLIAQTDQSPWSQVAIAPMLGGDGDAVLVHLPIEAAPFESGLAVTRRNDALAASPTPTATMPVDARAVETARASEPRPAATVDAPPALAAAERITAVEEVRSSDLLEPVVTRSGSRTMLLASKP